MSVGPSGDRHNPSDVAIHGERPEAGYERARLLRNTALNAAGQGLSLAVGLAALPILVRGLGPQRFGLLSLAFLIVGNTTVLDVGLGRATTKLLAAVRDGDEGAHRIGTLWTSLALHAVIGIVGGVVLWLVTPLLVTHVLKVPPDLQQEAAVSFLVVALSVPFVLIGSCLRGALEALLRFDLVNFVKVPGAVLLYVLPAILIVLGHGLVPIMVVTGLNRAVLAGGYAVVLVRSWPGVRRPSLHRPVVRELLSFGSWVWITNLSGVVLGYVDRLVIGAVLGLAALGYYSAPSDAIGRAYMVPAGLVGAIFPAFSGLAQRNREDLYNLFAIGVKVLVVVLLPLTAILVCFAPWVLRTWLGADYAAHTVVVFDILLVGALASSLGWVPYAFLQACGRPDAPAKVQLYEMPAFGLVLWGLVSLYGIAGAAAAWALRVTGEVVAFFWFAKRLDRSVLDALVSATTLGSIGQIALIPALMLVRVALLGHATWLGNAVVGLGIVLFLGRSWRHFFTAAERDALAGFLVARR